MKKILLIGLLMFASLLQAQVLNVRLGINHSDQNIFWNEKSEKGNHIFYPGICFGAQIDFDLNNNWYFSPGLFYDAKGYAEKVHSIILDYDNSSLVPQVIENIFTLYYRINYLDMPILVKKQFELGSHLKMFVGGGGYIGFKLSSCITSSESNNCDKEFFKSRIRTTDVGLQSEIGFIYNNKFTLNIGYAYGLLDIKVQNLF